MYVSNLNNIVQSRRHFKTKGTDQIVKCLIWSLNKTRQNHSVKNSSESKSLDTALHTAQLTILYSNGLQFERQLCCTVTIWKHSVDVKEPTCN